MRGSVETGRAWALLIARVILGLIFFMGRV